MLKTFNKDNILEAMALGPDRSYNGLQFVEATVWSQDFDDFQERKIIFKEVDTNTFWCYTQSRTGSPYTEWYYDDQYDEEVRCLTVEQKVITVTKWVPIP